MPSINAPKTDATTTKNQRRANAREEARARAQALREEEKRAAQRKRIALIVGAIVLLAAIVAAAVALVRHDRAGSGTMQDDGLKHVDSVIELSAPKNVTPYGGISVGASGAAGTDNGEDARQVDVFFDYTCHYCNDLEREYGPKLAEAARAGNITLVYHPLILLQGEFSFDGAAAEFYVAENAPEQYLDFHDAMHDELMAHMFDGSRTASPSAEEIAEVAASVGVSESVCEGLKDAIENEEYGEWSAQVTSQFFADGFNGTPAIFINGLKQENWRTGGEAALGS